MHHGLLVATKHVAQSWILLQGLPHPGDIAVAKNSNAGLEEAHFPSIPGSELVLEEGDNGLRNRQSMSHGWHLDAIVGIICPVKLSFPLVCFSLQRRGSIAQWKKRSEEFLLHLEK